MSTLTWITKKELERDIKNKGDQFRWNFIAAVRKMRNASDHHGETEWQRKKSEQEQIQHFLHKTCN